VYGLWRPPFPFPFLQVLNYTFSKVARLTFLTHSRSWDDFRRRRYAEMAKIDFQARVLELCSSFPYVQIQSWGSKSPCGSWLRGSAGHGQVLLSW
jgi:hypothetical protein